MTGRQARCKLTFNGIRYIVLAEVEDMPAVVDGNEVEFVRTDGYLIGFATASIIGVPDGLTLMPAEFMSKNHKFCLVNAMVCFVCAMFVYHTLPFRLTFSFSQISGQQSRV